MVDPVLRLALAIQANKGVYALLLGSGISRTAGIPTGWDVTLDLIRKFARLRGEECEPEPDAWYARTTGRAADYSHLLDELTVTPAERMQLLRPYFEPTEDERSEGLKSPSEAHRAVAVLVAKGYVRVILTTNFDRLMEQALADLEIQASVIASSDSVRGALPLAHSPCTVIKIHGDYLDTRSKNTLDEVSSFDESMDGLLDRVFDEYGLVVCGWSSEWDVALRRAIERCPNRRFGAFWAAYKGTTTPEAERLISSRGAQKISIDGADRFFVELVEKVSALESFSVSDPLPAKVAVARMKKYLQEPLRPIDFRDLVNAEVERVYTVIHSDAFQAGRFAPSAALILATLPRYEAAMRVLTAMLGCGGHWASDEYQVECLCAAVKRLADDPGPHSGAEVWFCVRLYPSLLALYALGLGAVARGKFSTLRRLLETNVRHVWDPNDRPIVDVVNAQAVLAFELPGLERHHTPSNDHVFEALRDVMRDSLPDDSRYAEAFDTFEYLAGMVGFKNSKRGACGRFLWRTSGNSIQTRTAPMEDGSDPPLVRSVLNSGLFGPPGIAATAERFRTVKQGFDAFIERVRNERMIFF